MNLTQGNILEFGNSRGVIDIVLYCPSNNSSFNTLIDSNTIEYNESTKFEDIINYNITHDQLLKLSFQNSFFLKLTRGNLVVNVPIDNSVDTFNLYTIFKKIYKSVYLYMNIDIYVSENNNSVTRKAIIDETKPSDKKQKTAYRYSEKFLVNNKKLITTTDEFEIYEFSIISTNWFNFHKSIYYSTKGLYSSVMNILSNTYINAGLNINTITANNNTLLNSTHLIYSTSANDNLVTIEAFLKQKQLNTLYDNMYKAKRTYIINNVNNNNSYLKSVVDMYGLYGNVIFNRLTNSYIIWNIPNKELIQYLQSTNNIKTLVLIINNTLMPTTDQAILLNAQNSMNKSDIILKQQQVLYSIYDYDDDSISYNFVTQQLKSNIAYNDVIDLASIRNNLMFPYHVTEKEQAYRKQKSNTYEPTYVIPKQQNVSPYYSVYSSNSEDSTNIVNDIENTVFNGQVITVYTTFDITYEVGNLVQIIHTGFAEGIKQQNKQYSYTNALADYNGIYIIKSINLEFNMLGNTGQTLTLSKLTYIKD